MNKSVRVPTASVVSDPEQPRKHFPEEEILAFSQNFKQIGQQVPVIGYEANGKFVLLDGERRWRAAKLAGITDLSAILLAARPSLVELRILQNSLDLHRASLTLMERSNLLAKIQAETKWSIGELAERLSMTQSLVSKLLAFQKLAEPIQALLHTGGLDGEKAYIVSREPDHNRQLELVKTAVHQSRDHLRAKVKHPGEQPRTKRSVFRLPSGMCVTVSGCEADLEDVIDGLHEVLKEIKRGRAHGLDITTAEKVMRDKAKIKS